jgi:hypothetical protein
MPKHNKKRNTAFLYEVLIREVIKQTVNKNIKQRNRVIVTLKECFKKNSEIGKELQLFKNLSDTCGLKIYTAEKLIQETKKEYKNLDTNKIFKEQSELIKKINKEISKNVFSNFVPNYKDIATLSQIFNDDVSAKRRVILEEGLLTRMTLKETAEKKKKSNLSGLVVNKFVDRFNSQYNSTLLEGQRTLLNKFILSFLDNGADLKVYLNEEIELLKKKINNSFDLEELKQDEDMTTKMEEVKNLLEKSNQKPIDKEFLQQILKIQALTKETES